MDIFTLYSQNACILVPVCVCVSMDVLYSVSMDKILHFTNTLIIIKEMHDVEDRYQLTMQQLFHRAVSALNHDLTVWTCDCHPGLPLMQCVSSRQIFAHILMSWASKYPCKLYP